MSRLRRLRRFADLSQIELARASGIPQPRLSEFERGKPLDRERLDRLVAACVAASRQIDPVTVAYVDGEISAADPKILIAEAKIIANGIDEALELIHASMEIAEIDTLAAFARIGFDRLAQIRRALEPLTKVPS